MDKKKIKKLYDLKIKELTRLNKFYYEQSKPAVKDSDYDSLKTEILSLEKKSRLDSQIYQEVLSPSSNIEEAAKNFYAALHRLDHMNLDLIVTSFFPDKGIGKTINDRLKRAVKK